MFQTAPRRGSRFLSRSFNVSEHVAVVVVNQESIDWAQREKGWSWPWPRSAYGDVVRYFNEGGAASVAFDIVFSEPSMYGEADDKYFAAACTEFGRTVQVMYHDIGTNRTVRPIDLLAQSAALIGSSNSLFDSDGVVRRARFFYEAAGDERIPSLGIAGLFAAEQKPDLSAYTQNNALLRFPLTIDDYFPYDMQTILTSLEAVQNGANFSGDIVDPHQFENMHIFVGYYAPGLYDICTTPVSSTYPGMGVHVAQLSNYLSADFITATPVLANILILFLCAVAGLFPVALGNKFAGKNYTIVVIGGSFLTLVALYAATAWITFSVNVYIPLSAPIFCLGFSFIVYSVRNNIVEGNQRRYLKAAFKQYISPEVIERLIAHPDSLRLGGERRTITMFFSDIQKFSSISEKLEPEVLTELLNEFLSAMSDIILQRGGTIDKYVGDSIVAFWNAPADNPQHASLALEASMLCQKEIERLQPQLEAKYGSPIFMRIGLNTGNAIVGNMGSRIRFDYTMLGDSVNLASRLEGLNKQFGTYLMCSQATMQAAKTQGCTLQFRELGRVAVVGKTEAVTVFEPVEPLLFAKKNSMFNTYFDGLRLYYEGKFSDAIKVFSQAAMSDPPSRAYIEICTALKDNPPAHWNGVFTATSK
jgi:adenylate cyclase